MMDLLWVLYVILAFLSSFLVMLLLCGVWKSRSRTSSGSVQHKLHDNYRVLQNIRTPSLFKDKQGSHERLGCVHVSHRGGSWCGPANSMLTYKRAVHDFQTQVIEIDLHLSADGHVVLMHDPVVDNTTNGSGLIAEMTLAQLKRLDTGYWWSPKPSPSSSTDVSVALYPERGIGHTVPTLQEVFDEFAEAHPELVFFLDFKAEAAVLPAMKMIQDRGKLLENRIICGAVAPSTNRALMAAVPPGIPCAVDFVSMLKLLILYWLGLLWLVYPLQHQILGFFVNHRTEKLMSKRLFKTLQETGSVVALFGPGTNDEANQRKYLEMGVDMLVTDRPDILRNTLNSLRRAPAPVVSSSPSLPSSTSSSSS